FWRTTGKPSSIYKNIFTVKLFRQRICLMKTDQQSCLPRMAWRQFKGHITVLVMASVALRLLTSQQCGTDLRSIYQMMLQGHTFKTLKTQPGTTECIQACRADIRCQSFNVVFKGICELNNRTKEARPDDFVKDLERYYVKSSTRGKKTK
ncbi:unnamed protein product, partial [Pocillopora meandrina]